MKHLSKFNESSSEYRLGELRKELQNMMSLYYNLCKNMKNNSKNASQNIQDIKEYSKELYQFISLHSLWSRCLDPNNVIDQRDIEIWEKKKSEIMPDKK